MKCATQPPGSMRPARRWKRFHPSLRTILARTANEEWCSCALYFGTLTLKFRTVSVRRLEMHFHLSTFQVFLYVVNSISEILPHLSFDRSSVLKHQPQPFTWNRTFDQLFLTDRKMLASRQRTAHLMVLSTSHARLLAIRACAHALATHRYVGSTSANLELAYAHPQCPY